MADPRFKCQVADAANQSALRAFGQAAGKLGDLNVVNSANGNVGRGLRTLASASNSIRSGCGTLPNSIGSSIESGANWVLGHMGITPSTLQAVNNINPAAANNAVAGATAIFNQVKSGKFKATDIPNYLQNFQNVETLARNIYTPATTTPIQGIDCLSTPYAIDLVSRAPKHKFMFVVEVHFNPAYEQISKYYPIAFSVKSATRPTVKFATEDVNYYNFRTKVITRTDFEEVKMVFHDDFLDTAMGFYNSYRNAMSPITNLDQDTVLDMESRGMDFNNALVNNAYTNIVNSIPANVYSASRGPLVGDAKHVLQWIKLYHIFESGNMVNVYTFINPRITDMSLDELNMAVANEGTDMSFSFNYDTVYINTVSMKDLTQDNIFNGQALGTAYPLRYNTDLATAQAAHAALPKPPAPDACTPPGNINTSIT